MSLLKRLVFERGLECVPATSDAMDDFQRKITGKLSPDFVTFCKSFNGGCPMQQNAWFVPNKTQDLYWWLCENRYHDTGGQIEVLELYGLETIGKSDLVKRSENTRRVWSLPADLWVVASDGVGINLASRLQMGADEVYYFEPNVEPHMFKISDSLVEFYNNLGPAPDGEYS